MVDRHVVRYPFPLGERIMNAAVFKVLDWTERRIARLRGKGYGSFSITKEVDLAIRLLGSSPRFVEDMGEIGGPHVGTQVPNAHPDCDLLLEKKKIHNKYHIPYPQKTDHNITN